VLHELRIESLLLIGRAELRLGEGLNVITGETGAGKTVLAHSLDLLMGGKARPQIVRPGAEEAYVEGVFSIPDGLFDDPELAEIAERLPDGAGEIVLARRVGASGRTSAFVAGRAASAADLRALGARLLAFYGQHEHRRLTLGSAQLEVLDGFAGGAHLERRREYRSAHAEVTAVEAELAELREREGARERDLDLLRFELEEIEAASPDPAEAAELASERERLRHAESLRAAAGGALARMSGDEDAGAAASLLAEAETSLAGVDGVDAGLDAIAERARALTVEIADVAAELRSYLDGIEAEPGRLEEVEERLDAVERLKRKHGGSVEAVLEHAERCRAEIARLDGAEELAGELEKRLAAAHERRAALAGELTAARRKAAGKLEKRVAGELSELAMEGASLEVVLEPHTDGLAATGAEAVTFNLATNPGIPVSALRDAASGGELSRVMLALSGLGPDAGAPTVAFDEIDAGIGGNTARAVGERLRDLGGERQVICITHLPQVASLASTHFRISKSVEKGEALATVERVAGDELVAEITRMLGGEQGDDAASRHARELLEAA
jgi:DNA repair protein RecN (Recombination protein N)